MTRTVGEIQAKVVLEADSFKWRSQDEARFPAGLQEGWGQMGTGLWCVSVRGPRGALAPRLRFWDSASRGKIQG